MNEFILDKVKFTISLTELLGHVLTYKGTYSLNGIVNEINHLIDVHSREISDERVSVKERKIVDYSVVYFLEVKDLLDDGWTLYGNPFQGASGANAQAMVKYED